MAQKKIVLRLNGKLVEALEQEGGGDSPSMVLKSQLYISLLQPKSDAILILIIYTKQTGVGCNYPWQII